MRVKVNAQRRTLKPLFYMRDGCLCAVCLCVCVGVRVYLWFGSACYIFFAPFE